MKRFFALLLCLALCAMPAAACLAESAENAENVENVEAVEKTENAASPAARDAEIFTLYWEGKAIADAVAACRMDGSVILVTSADAIPTSDALMNAEPLTTMDQRLGDIAGIWRVDLTPLALVAFETDTHIAALTDFPYAGAPALCAGSTLRGGLQGYSSHDVSRVSAVTLDGVNGWTFFSAEDFLPGSVVMDERADICGIVLSSWGEGLGKYFAVSTESIMDALSENDITEVALEGLPAYQNDSGIEFTYDGGILTIDLSGVPLTEEQAAQNLRVYVNAYPNQYQEWHDFAPGDSLVTRVLALPESSLAVFLCQGEGEDENTLLVQPYTVPAASFMDRYSYADSEIYLGVSGSGDPLADDEAALPVDHVTVDELFGGEKRFYFQMISSYRVEQETREPLLMALTAPDGQFVCQSGTFIYMPEIEERDVWHFDLTNSLAMMAEFTGKQSGTYTLAYYLDGSIAGMIEFEVGE